MFSNQIDELWSWIGHPTLVSFKIFRAQQSRFPFPLCVVAKSLTGIFHGTGSPEISSDGTFVYMAYATDIPGLVGSQGTKMFRCFLTLATKPLSLCFLVGLRNGFFLHCCSLSCHRSLILGTARRSQELGTAPCWAILPWKQHDPWKWPFWKMIFLFQRWDVLVPVQCGFSFMEIVIYCNDLGGWKMKDVDSSGCMCAVMFIV